MKYTKSRDGKLRVNLRATIRIERDDLLRMRALAKREAHDGRLSTFLHDCLYDGFHAVLARLEEDGELDRIYGRESEAGND